MALLGKSFLMFFLLHQSIAAFWYWHRVQMEKHRLSCLCIQKTLLLNYQHHHK
jgi:hypothetical protein